MSKVASKLQLTLPKALAEKYGIRAGDEIDWTPAADSIRLVPSLSAQARDTAAREVLLSG